MEIYYFDKLDSTQKHLTKLIRDGLNKEIAIVTKEQIAGVGSRNSSWISNRGDLLFSFSIKKDNLPKDLMLQSASIYFAYIFKEVLHEFDNECWLKWPNDIYKKNKKVGGVVTQLIKDYFVVGIGLNLIKREDNFGFLETQINVDNMLNSYFMLLKKKISWQEIFKKFRVEYEKKNYLQVHINGELKTLQNAILCDDGALLIDNERIYSSR